METLIQIAAGTLAILITWAVARLSARLGLDPALAAHLTELAVIAASKAEGIARSTGYKGPQKMQAALRVLDGLVANNPELAKAVAKRGKDIIEGVLKSPFTSAEMTPKA